MAESLRGLSLLDWPARPSRGGPGTGGCILVPSDMGDCFPNPWAAANFTSA